MILQIMNQVYKSSTSLNTLSSLTTWVLYGGGGRVCAWPRQNASFSLSQKHKIFFIRNINEVKHFGGNHGILQSPPSASPGCIHLPSTLLTSLLHSSPLCINKVSGQITGGGFRLNNGGKDIS